MSTTLYLLRQQPNRISPCLFQASDMDIDVVFIEDAASIAVSAMKGVVENGEGMVVTDSHQTLTYDDLVEKIFSSDQIIVI